MDSALGIHNPLADVAFPFGVVAEPPQHHPPARLFYRQFLSAVCSGLTFHTTQEFLLHSFYPLYTCTEYKLILHILLTQKEVEFKEIESKDSLSLHAFGL